MRRKRQKANKVSTPEPSRSPDKRPTIGWANRHWTQYVACAVCGRGVRAGVVHHKDKTDPPVRAMCLACYDMLMYDPDKFRELHPSEEGPDA